MFSKEPRGPNGKEVSIDWITEGKSHIIYYALYHAI